MKLTLFLFLVISSVLGQGALKGVVLDSLTNETLVGANVYLQGTGFGAATDLEGEFRITNIPEGTYNVIASYIGYVQQRYPVTIVKGKTLLLDINLPLDILLSHEVVISAQAKGQVAAINQQLTSNTIVNIVSEEKIQELPDANAAEAIGRLPGVSLIRTGGEASKIILRGLSDKYTNVTMDGVLLPSTDALERGLDLSSISQSSLAGIELFKALTADKDADAIAGSVNFVTKKAPKERMLRGVFKGGYNDLMGSLKQYDLSVRYGERFFDDVIGVQLSANLENKIRSNEHINVGYDQTKNHQTDYFINNLTLEFNDEVRKRNGFNILLDAETPDGGVVKFSTSYNATRRDYLTSNRDYPFTGQSSQTGGVSYTYRDRVQDIKTFSTALTGENNIYGFRANWGISFAQSTTNFPYDYELDFAEPFLTGTAGMRTAEEWRDQPERLIPYAYNNFLAATLSEGFYRTQDNLDKDKAVYLDLLYDYYLSHQITGEVKFGGKYKSKTRTNRNSQTYSPYYLGSWRAYEKLEDGTIQAKDLMGTYFEDFFLRYQSNHTYNTLSFQEFLDSTPDSKMIFDKYDLNPIINRDFLRQWYDLNRFGTNSSGVSPEYSDDPSVQANSYNITEAVTSFYAMNTLNIGNSITFIAGVRVESEDNFYINKYSKGSFSGFPVPIGITRDTTSSYTETIWLPNFHLNIKATDFMNIRLAAYKALARPDFNMRLNTFFAWRPSSSSGNKQLYLGNPILKTAQAWNFEINTSFYGNDIGLISLSAFYKEIDDMYHMLNAINTQGNALIDNLNLAARTPHIGTYQLTVPYNSPKPSKVWGFEIEHQVNLTFLPGFLKNFVLSYNASMVRSETYLISARTDTTYVTVPGFPFPLPEYNDRAVELKQQLENQPKFYGNISLGYEAEDFSIRVSMFHQSEYYSSYSSSRRSDRIIGSYTRFDLAAKYNVTKNISVLLNIANLTNIQEDNWLDNQVNLYKILRSSEYYGLTADLGVRIEL